MIRKLLIAGASVALAASSLAAAAAVTGSGVAAAVAPTTTFTCSVGGAVTFASPGLSAGGALTSATVSKTAAAITPTGTGCSGLPIAISIPSATTACPVVSPGVPDPSGPAACQASKTKNGVTTYAIGSKPNYYGTTASYATTGVSSLAAALTAKPLKTTVDGIPLVLMYGSAAQVTPGGACGSDVGFYLAGNAMVKAAVVGTYTSLACLSADTGIGTSNNFFNDLLSPLVTIATATVGGASDLVVTFPNSDCAVGGTVTFAKPGLSAGGALTSATVSKTAAAITPTGTGCSGLPIAISIPSATTACPVVSPGVPDPSGPAACQASKTKNGVTTYAIGSKPNYYGTTASYATTGVSSLAAALTAKPLKTTVDGIPLVLMYGSAAQVTPGGACGSDVGFYLAGNAMLKAAVVGTYTSLACLSADTGIGTSNNFFNDLLSPLVTIATATVGGSSDLAVTFG